jgi:hypothetical protein
MPIKVVPSLPEKPEIFGEEKLQYVPLVSGSGKQLCI